MIVCNRWSFGLWLLVGFIHFSGNLFVVLRDIEILLHWPMGHRRRIYKEERQRSSLLLGGKNLFNSLPRYTLPKVIDFPRYNMKCSGENVIQSGIFHLVSGFPLHFMLYCRNLDLEIGQFNRYFVPGKKGRQTPGLYEEKDEFILFFKSSWWKIASAARNWYFISACLYIV